MLVSSAENDMLPGEAELKRQELKDARILVEDATQQLTSRIFRLL